MIVYYLDPNNQIRNDLRIVDSIGARFTKFTIAFDIVEVLIFVDTASNDSINLIRNFFGIEFKLMTTNDVWWLGVLFH